jgi:hypothetical protein
MWEDILKIVPVYLSSMAKFFFGPLAGYAAGVHIVTTMAVTVAGMMTTIFLFVYLGEWFKATFPHWFHKKEEKLEAPDSRMTRIWKRYGLVGIAVLTPVLLSPIGGGIFAVASGSPKRKIILYMFLSAVFWSPIQTCFVYYGIDAFRALDLPFFN